jgi:hypothetical protein
VSYDKSEAAEDFVLNHHRRLYATQERFEHELIREEHITLRIATLMKSGFWPPPRGWCMDLLAPLEDIPPDVLEEALREPPPKPRLVTVDGERCDD